MSSFPYQAVPVNCPNCKYRYVAPVLTIVDVGQQPQAKALLLSGQINIAVCPQCGHAGMLQTPLVYHDPDRELLLTFAPSELGMSEIEQQRIIGDLTNRVISALPAEKRKGYLLRPRSYLRLEALIKDILEAEGITEEILDAQRARADLLERLLVTSDDEARQAMIQANDLQIDYEFLDLVALNIELAQRSQAGDGSNLRQIGGSTPPPEPLGELLALREQLLRWTTVGQEIAAREEAIESLGPDITREGLLGKLVEAALAGEAIKVETMIAVARPAIDYLFYQQLTDRITMAEQAGDRQQAETLTELRRTILELTTRLDEEAQQAAEETRHLLQQALDSEDPQAFVRANAGRVDNLFMTILTASLQAAEQAGQSEIVKRLQQVSDAVMALVLESQPPEIRFINELMAVEYPEQTKGLLQENQKLIDARLLEIMRLVAADLTSSGREETAKRLDQIREQARSLADLQARPI